MRIESFTQLNKHQVNLIYKKCFQQPTQPTKQNQLTGIKCFIEICVKSSILTNKVKAETNFIAHDCTDDLTHLLS